MKAAGLWLPVVLLAGCVTEGAGLNAKPDLAEAARLNTELGADLLRKGQLDAALEKLQRAVKQDDDYAPAQAALALTYQQLGNPNAARPHFRRALRLDPKNPAVQNNYGFFLCQQDDLEDGEAFLVKAATDRSYNTPEIAWTNAGLCALRAGQGARAESHFREALKANPTFAEALAQMARRMHEAGDPLRARAFIQRFERAANPRPDMLLLAARTERQLGDRGSAALYERRLKREFPEAPEIQLLSNPTP